MLKKSLILATLLISNAFGSELSERGSNSNLDLAGIRKMVLALRVPFSKAAHSDKSPPSSIAEFNEVATLLQLNPIMLEADPSIISDIGAILLDLGEKESAIALYKFLLGLDKHKFGFFMGHACLKLHELGETDLAIKTLMQLRSAPFLRSEVRENATKYFCLITKKGIVKPRRRSF